MNKTKMSRRQKTATYFRVDPAVHALHQTMQYLQNKPNVDRSDLLTFNQLSVLNKQFDPYRRRWKGKKRDWDRDYKSSPEAVPRTDAVIRLMYEKTLQVGDEYLQDINNMVQTLKNSLTQLQQKKRLFVQMYLKIIDRRHELPEKIDPLFELKTKVRNVSHVTYPLGNELANFDFSIDYVEQEHNPHDYFIYE